MSSVYVETSFVSACVTARSDAASVYRRETSLDWWNTQRIFHDVALSEEVLTELSHPTFQRRNEALAFVSDVPILSVTDEVRGLAKTLVREKVMPGPVAGDAMHVAAATVHEMEYIITWNVRHLANVNKTEHLSRICLRFGLTPPRIITPDLLWRMDHGSE